MGLFRKLLFVVGVALIALPLLFLLGILPLNIIPSGSFYGIDNTFLSIALGILLLLLAFWSWNRERKRRMLFGGRFMGPRGPGDAHVLSREQVQRLRALQGA